VRPTTDQDAIRFLVREVPELAPLLDEHLRENDGLLTYVVFQSEFTRWFCDGVLSDADEEPLRRFAAAIEVLMDTPVRDSVWNLAGVAFGEALAFGEREGGVLEKARPWLGSATLADIEYMRNWKPEAPDEPGS
jgi:hypothetical protein